MTDPQRITVPTFATLKQRGQKICMLTAYDYPTAELVDSAGVDAILVGDSLSMVVQGHANTLPVTLDQMIYHAELVSRAVRRALVVVDLPFPTFHLGRIKAIECGARVLKETRAQAVKLEGGQDQADVIDALVGAGIPVMAHCGLRPQTVMQMGGYRIQRDEPRLLVDARSAQEAGAFAVVLECVPAAIAARVTAELKIPTIGIGAGAGCDGQVLVLHDLIGLTSGRVPRFARQLADARSLVGTAVAQYCEEVRRGSFPAEAETLE
jgi:3-methyl-2-oxobutanoate hydroxymethyltransferase